MRSTGPVCLVVLDGYGIGDGGEGDATRLAETPFFERAQRLYPRTQLETSGPAVGLPEGQMGNSEVGHMTLGAGRVIEQDMVRIDSAIAAGALDGNEVAEALFARAESAGRRLHLLGLVSDGGVHSSLDHLDGILRALEARGIAPVLHAFTDGRDTPPRSALEWIRPLEERLRAQGGCVATLAGRYWAMDRDGRWDRVARAYAAIVERRGVEAGSAVEAVEKGYGRDEGDEFIAPTVVSGGPPLEDGSAALHFNFRSDRARELTNALTRTAPGKLGREIEALPRVRPSCFVTLTEFDAEFDLPVLFAPVEVRESLGEVVSGAGLRQLRIAETEKYAHVTYFFNGGREEPFAGEDRILVPSPKDVPTYDLKPEMSAVEVTDRLLEALERNDYSFVLVNYDACLDRLCAAVLARGGTLLVTADHGNVEQLLDPDSGGPHTAHTTNPVPLYWIVERAAGRSLAAGGLADLAPSLCELLGLAVPDAMNGRSLLR
jgi:2,3-bisphosphoglycerate-independent phosphoglycerate mutase